jgi:hypothetical protein
MKVNQGDLPGFFTGPDLYVKLAVERGFDKGRSSTVLLSFGGGASTLGLAPS